jgi:hypothetical protein
LRMRGDGVDQFVDGLFHTGATQAQKWPQVAGRNGW